MNLDVGFRSIVLEYVIQRYNRTPRHQSVTAPHIDQLHLFSLLTNNDLRNLHQSMTSEIQLFFRYSYTTSSKDTMKHMYLSQSQFPYPGTWSRWLRGVTCVPIQPPFPILTAHEQIHPPPTIRKPILGLSTILNHCLPTTFYLQTYSDINKLMVRQCAQLFFSLYC
jgi:hypothetical protein